MKKSLPTEYLDKQAPKEQYWFKASDAESLLKD